MYEIHENRNIPIKKYHLIACTFELFTFSFVSFVRRCCVLSICVCVCLWFRTFLIFFSFYACFSVGRSRISLMHERDRWISRICMWVYHCGMSMMRTKQINYNNFNKFIARSCLTEEQRSSKTYLEFLKGKKTEAKTFKQKLTKHLFLSSNRTMAIETQKNVNKNA